MNPNKAAIYARFSPGADREKSSTIQVQIAMCRQKVEADGFTVDEVDITGEKVKVLGSMSKEIQRNDYALKCHGG